MGDRANIYLIDSPRAERGMYLYTHWAGYRWPEALREALDFGQGRWGDPQYLARIVTSRVFADIADSETGGGLSTTIGDNEYPIVVVDLVRSTVGFAKPGDERKRALWQHVRPFAEYVKSEVGYPSDVPSR